MAKTLAERINEVAYGELSEKGGEKIVELIRDCRATGRAGSVTVTLKFIPGKAGQMHITGDLKITEPKKDKYESIMFDLPSGELSRDDPAQANLPGIRKVSDRDARQPLDVDRSTGEVRSA